MDSKIDWWGCVLSVQPRIRLLRSFDERSHSYLGYVLAVRGTIGGVARDFSVAVGKGAHEKHRFGGGDVVEGSGVPIGDARLETADLYKVSGLKIGTRGPENPVPGPPYTGVPPALDVYRKRGHRRLSTRTFSTACLSCLWGCEMPVEMIIDHWNPSVKKYRRETFCYGPKNCRFYKPGPNRSVPGRKGMVWVEEDWIEEEETAHRGPDE